MTKKTALRCRHRPQGPWLLKVQQQSPLAERRKVSRDQLALAEKTKNQKKEQGGVRNKLTDDAPGTPLPGLQPERRPARSAEDAAGVWIPVTMAAGINRAHI